MTIVIETTVSDVQLVLQTIFNDVMADFNSPGYGTILAGIQPELERIHQGYFDAAMDPNGNAWPPLAPSTIERKGHNKILIDTTALKQSLTSSGAANAYRDIRDDGSRGGITFGTSVDYATYHMTGTSKMPARPPVGLNEQTVTKIAETIADKIVVAMTDKG